jgi:hypothetical protein
MSTRLARLGPWQSGKNGNGRALPIGTYYVVSSSSGSALHRRIARLTGEWGLIYRTFAQYMVLELRMDKKNNWALDGGYVSGFSLRNFGTVVLCDAPSMQMRCSWRLHVLLR